MPFITSFIFAIILTIALILSLEFTNKPKPKPIPTPSPIVKKQVIVNTIEYTPNGVTITNTFEYR